MTLIVVEKLLRTLKPKDVHLVLGLAAIGPEDETVELLGVLLRLDDDGTVGGLILDDGGDFGDFRLP